MEYITRHPEPPQVSAERRKAQEAKQAVLGGLFLLPAFVGAPGLAVYWHWPTALVAPLGGIALAFILWWPAVMFDTVKQWRKSRSLVIDWEERLAYHKWKQREQELQDILVEWNPK